MASNPSQQPGNNPPAKPWERSGTSSGPAPFKPPSSGNTSDVVEASGTAKPGEIVSNTRRNVIANTNTLGRPLPSRPWEQNYGSNYGGSYGGYGSTMNNSGYGYGSGMYNSIGGMGGAYGGGLYGNSMYNRGYGGLHGGSGMYGIGGSMLNNGYGNSMVGGYGMGMGGPYGNQDPNDPYGPPPSPPGFWMSFLRVMQGVVNFSGRVSILIDQNAQAFHMFMSALLQLFDRSGMLYGEVAGFVLRLLGVKTKPRKHEHEHELGPGDHPGPPNVNVRQAQQHYIIEGPKAPAGPWDGVWEDDDDGAKGSSS